MYVCWRPPSTWRYSPLVQRKGAIGSGAHRFEDQAAPASGQMLASAWRDYDSVSHEHSPLHACQHIGRVTRCGAIYWVGRGFLEIAQEPITMRLGAVKKQSPVLADLFRDKGCGE
jgi:hypothetical protein